MEITWHGGQTVEINDTDLKLVINPTSKTKADIVLSSEELENKDQHDARKIFDWPGEYEMKGVPIVGVTAWKKNIETNPDLPASEQTTIFHFTINKVNFCHLGNLGHKLTKDLIKEIGDIDVLFVDASENSELTTKQKVEALETIDPRILIPIGEGNFSAFLTDIGAEKNESQTSLKLSGAAKLPDESRETVILEKQ